MKKIYTLLIIHFLFISQLKSQSCINLENKYENYRKRLVSDFLLGVGPDQGFSIPAENRNEHDHYLHWGDAGTYLGQYIAVLASEYRLYTLAGKNTENTIKELFYALYAFNRLDKYAEPQFSGIGSNAPSLNGFFIRDDVDYFNYLSPTVQDHLNHGNTNHSEINVTESDFIDGDHYNKEESIDQIIQLLYGLGFVKILLPSNVTYISSSGTEVFQDGETNIQQEAINIINRMVGYTHDFYGVNSGCWNALCWDIFNPVTGTVVHRGSHFGDLSYALDKAWDFLTGNHITPILPADIFDKSSAKSIFQGFSLSLINNNLHNAESDKICTMAAISDAWESNTDDNSDYINQIEENNYIHVPLIHSIFHPGTRINSWSKQQYLSILNDMPDAIPPFTVPANCGNFMYGPAINEHSIWEWTSPSRILHYELRGDYTGYRTGEFNGLDFMLLYNLYYLNICCPTNLYFENKNYTSGQKHFEAYNNLSAGFDTGDPQPNGNVTIQAGASVKYQAGNEIMITDGFFALPASEFEAHIESCCPELFPAGIDVHSFPNDFSPDGDGWEEELCISVSNATSYHVKVFLPGGLIEVYNNSGTINSDPVCVWDGQGADPWNFSEDYIVKVVFYGCDGTYENQGTVHADGTNLQLKNDSTYQSSTPDSTNFDTPNENSEVNRLSYLNSILIYPNPGNGEFIVESNIKLSDKIEVYDMFGRQVFFAFINSQLTSINLSDLIAGVYIAKVFYKNGKIFSKKLIIK